VDDSSGRAGHALRKAGGLRNVIVRKSIALEFRCSPVRCAKAEECAMSVTSITEAAEAKRKSKDAATHFAKEQLKAYVERIEHLEEEKKAIADDIKDVYAEAKGNGYDVKALRKIISLRKQDKDERAEQEAILETYMQALGMI
jgi:uncharacterized protein (UPF0335 family)